MEILLKNPICIARYCIVQIEWVSIKLSVLLNIYLGKVSAFGIFTSA